MSSAVEIREYREDDFDELVERMRPADVAECIAAYGDGWKGCLRDDIAAVDSSFSVFAHGSLMCSLGYAEHEISTKSCRVCTAWLMTTDTVSKHKFLFWRTCKSGIRDIFFDNWDVIVCAVHSGHSAAIAWLLRLGFSRGRRLMPRSGGEFFIFTAGRSDSCSP